jgi:hypothetical protein
MMYDLLASVDLVPPENTTLKMAAIAFCIASVFVLSARACFGQRGNEESVLRTFSQEEIRASGLRKLTPAELHALDAAISLRVQPLARHDDGGNDAAKGMEVLLGGYILGDDGEYLGLITTNEFDRKSLLNDIGPHGSDISPKSILNDIGRYGSDVSPKSAFNDIAMAPPRVFTKDGVFVGFLTTNDLKSPRIDPRALIGWLRSR